MDSALGRPMVDPLRLVGTELPFDELGEAICAAISERAPGLGAAMLRLDAPRRTLRVVANRRLPNLVIDELPLGRAGGPIGRAVSLDETIVDTSPWAEPQRPDALVAAAPIPHDGAPVGAVVVVGDASLVDDATILHLEACAQLVGLVAGRTDDAMLTIDPDSGLADRSAANAVLGRASSRTGGLGGTFVTVLVETGDQAATTRANIGGRLDQAARAKDHVFDLGEGRILLVCGHLGTAQHATPIVERVRETLHAVPTASEARVGAVVHRSPIDAGRVMERATSVTTSPLHRQPVISDLTEISEHMPASIDEIEVALQAGQIMAWYQPIVAAADGRVLGLEALARWHHAEGIRGADRFVPTLEATGRVAELTDAMLRAACADLSQWQRSGVVDAGFTISVNVSADELSDPTFPARVSSAVTSHLVAPSSIRIELTETLALSDRATAIRALTELRSLGFTVALDDFGTGYATFASMRSLPIDVVKIDRSFIGSLPDRSAESVVHSVVDLAGVLGLDVVAEGVETSEHLDFVRTAGVHHIQGYLVSPPVEPGRVPDLLTEVTGWAP